MAEEKTATEAAMEKAREKLWKQARHFGGIGWPWRDKPGFSVVLAVLGDEARVLCESAAGSVSSLYSWCCGLRAEYHVLDWYTDMDQPAMQMWRLIDERESGGGKWGLLPVPAPMAGHPDELAAYQMEMRSRTSGGVKTLHFGESVLPGLMRQFPIEDMGRQAREYPQLAALGYALTGSRMSRPRRMDVIVQQEDWSAWT